MTRLSGPLSPPPRRPTPTPGWESGVWVRIQRRRRLQRLGALLLAVGAAWGGTCLARRRGPPGPWPLAVTAATEGPLRPDGSAPVPSTWWLRFEGAELRVYRNGRGLMHRCPGAPGCASTGRGGTLALPVATAGEYRAVVFSRVPGTEGRTLHADVAAAGADGVRVELSAPLIAY